MAELETAIAPTTESPPVELPTPSEAQEQSTTKVAEEQPQETIEASPEPSPFDAYEALDREEMKPVLEARDKRREREIEARFATDYQEKTKNWEATQTANTLAGYIGNILQKVADADGDGFERSTQSLLQFAQPLMNDYRQAVQRAEASTISHALSVHMSQSLSRAKDRDEFDRFLDGRSPSWQEAFKEYVKLETSESLRRKDAEIADLKDALGKTKAEGRTNKGPSLTQSAPGGGGIDSYEEASRRYNLPMNHPQKITHEQFKEERARFGIK